jgi:hypothetical protein
MGARTPILSKVGLSAGLITSAVLEPFVFTETHLRYGVRPPVLSTLLRPGEHGWISWRDRFE